MKRFLAVLVVCVMLMMTAVALGENSSRKEIYAGIYEGSQSYEPGGYTLIGDDDTIAEVQIFPNSSAYMLYSSGPNDPSKAKYLYADIKISPDGISGGHVAFNRNTFMVVEIEKGHLYIEKD